MVRVLTSVPSRSTSRRRSPPRVAAPGLFQERALMRLLICAEPGDSTRELSAARARDLRATTRSRGADRLSHRVRAASMPIRNRSGSRVTLGQHRSLRGITAGLLPNSRNRKRSPVALGARNPQVTAMISVRRAAAGGIWGALSGLHGHRIHDRKMLMTWSLLTESNRRPSPYHLSTGRRCSHLR